MLFKWQKIGWLFNPYNFSNKSEKLLTHAANPLAIPLEKDIYRVFFSGRDIENRSSIGAVDIDIVKQKIICFHKEPFFEYGKENSFYSHGVSIGNYFNINDNLYIPFMGWQVPKNQHWLGEIGLLHLNQNFELHLNDEKPFLSFNEVDPISLSYPFILKENSNFFKMWYGSTITWDAGNNEMIHTINYAESSDGKKWDRKGVSVPYEIGKAQAFSKPSVIKLYDQYHMWFSYRSGTGEKYRIGYAYSDDGIIFHINLEKSGIDISNEGWDSEMIAYPYVFEHNENIYMLYNGNGYGKTGFGLAILDVF